MSKARRALLTKLSKKGVGIARKRGAADAISTTIRETHKKGFSGVQALNPEAEGWLPSALLLALTRFCTRNI